MSFISVSPKKKAAVLYKNGLYLIVAALVAIFVFGLLFWGGFKLVKVLSVLEADQPYKGKMVLFYGDNCNQCIVVDNFIEANPKIKEIIPLEKLEVFYDSGNADILIRKAKYCGLRTEDIGVPFLWDDQLGRCIYGYADIIDFFKEKLRLAG